MNSNETIFLTGFPGFIAERLVKRLAKKGVKFFLLVQSDFIEKAKRDVAEFAAETAVPVEDFVLVEGDITRENLGIREAELEIIKTRTTAVFHLAAVYDLAVEKNLAFGVNVEGTRRVNEFVKALPQLRRYNYVSTCYVAGTRTGEILETELEDTQNFRNFYEETKYLAEIEVERLKAEVPTTIYRPSVVVGDSESGETAKYDGIYYLINYLKIFPTLFRFVNVGNKNVRLNLVPVDFVVEGIAALSADENAVGKTFALADPNPLTTEEIFDVISENLSGRKSVITPPPSIVEKTLMLPFTPLMSGLPHSGVAYFFISQTYDTSVADRFLAAHNIKCPNFRSYVKNLLKFVEKNPKL
ncbi:MAG: SDR family oxidoreductase [Acidobacteriota bacterium]|nr:SDR family oxidoreductase [Acidobacteriota bacterium]